MSQVYQQSLAWLQEKNQLRQIPRLVHKGKFVIVDEVNNKPLINVATNDYLAIGMDTDLQTEFLDYINEMPKESRPKFGSTSSRLLTGNDVQLELLENELAACYNRFYDSKKQHSTEFVNNKSALIFNSGYHANIGLLPALTSIPVKTIIFADKLVHASIIDGMRLANITNKVAFKRYRHNDYLHLRNLITEIGADIQRIIIVTESIFSMDGDKADLAELVAIKQTMQHSELLIELYVDEAHAVGAIGSNGLGVAEETNTITQIDYIVGTFGKAFASMGAYVICHPDVKQWLINTMRTLIFSTALPPMTHAWSRFILQKMPELQKQRISLQKISTKLTKAIEQITQVHNPSQSAIIPYIVGENDLAIIKSQQLAKLGFYALPIRPPTVPKNTARIRLVMNTAISEQDCDKLIRSL